MVLNEKRARQYNIIVKNPGSRARYSKFKSKLCCFTLVKVLSSPSFVISKIEIIIVSSS